MGLYIVRIRTDTWDRLRDLQSLYDLDVFGQTAKQLADGSFEIQGTLSGERIRVLSEKGYRIEILDDALHCSFSYYTFSTFSKQELPDISSKLSEQA